MTELQDNRPVPCGKIPVRVFACLTTNRFTVLMHPGQGLADGGIPVEVATSLIPFDLRMPNAEVFILMRKDTSEIVKVLRVGEELHDARFFIDNA